MSGSLKLSIPSWPARRVTFAFEHDTVGDARFHPMIEQAMLELLAADKRGTLSAFTASNGVRITITPEQA